MNKLLQKWSSNWKICRCDSAKLEWST